MPLENSYSIAHLEFTNIFHDGSKSSGIHGVPLGDHSQVISHNVPQGEAQAFIVLGYIENRSDVSAVHTYGVRVLAPDSSMDHGGFCNSDLELLDNGFNRRSGSPSQTNNELRGS